MSSSSSFHSSLFRRLDVCPDGTHVCCTNATVKNRHVARMIPRNNHNNKGITTSAANTTCLVGHPHSIVCAKYFPYLLEISASNSSSNSNTTNEYATWLALGDKSGFVTIWSTQQSRPLLKVQCSETGNTITDLVWDPNGILYVSLLDGYIVKLHVPSNPQKLSMERVQRLFSTLYGIEGYAPGYTTMDIPNLILTEQEENSFAKHTLPHTYTTSRNTTDSHPSHDNNKHISQMTTPSSSASSQAVVVQQQQVTTKNGKKRITPISMSNNNATTTITTTSTTNNSASAMEPPTKKPTLLEQALQSAEKAAAIQSLAPLPSSSKKHSTSQQQQPLSQMVVKALFSIPIHHTPFVVEYSNTNNNNDSTTTTTSLIIRQNRKIIFQEQFLNHIGTSLVATNSRMVLGTSQGHLYVYKLHTIPSSSSMKENEAMILHQESNAQKMIVQKDIPPMIMDSAIHSVLLKEDLLLVVTAAQYHCYLYDLKQMKLLYKTMIPKHIVHQLVRIEWFQEQSFLVVVTLPFHHHQQQMINKKNQTQKQIWYYNVSMETFMRLADSHAHLLSKYAHSYYVENNDDTNNKDDDADERKKTKKEKPLLTEYEQVLQRSHPSSTKYLLERMMIHHQQQQQSHQPCTHATWAHLQDRLVTTKLLLPHSKNEYRHWLKLYVQHLAQQNSGPELSWLTEHLVSNAKKNKADDNDAILPTKEILQDIILPTLSEHSHMHDLQQDLSLYLHTL